MLNITIYSKVPFQKNYQNVLDISQISFDNYLRHNYFEGEITNVKTYFDGGDSIQLPIMYENCNYMRIEDTNSTQQIKYFFIDSTQFVSGNAVKYNITLDVWHTYKYNIDAFYDSLMIRGHADALNVNNGVVKLNSTKLPRLINRLDANETHLTNYLLEPFVIDANTNIPIEFIAFVSTDKGIKMIGSTYSTHTYHTQTNYVQFLQHIQQNKYYTGTEPNVTEHTFELLKLYAIPNFNLYDTYGNGYKAYLGYGANTLYFEVTVYDFKYSDGTLDGTKPIVKKINIATKTLFDTNIVYNQTNIEKRIKRKFLVGAINNNKEIETTLDFNNNVEMSLNLYLEANNTLQIIFESGNNKIDLTSSFELPTVNDSYNLYMNLNQKQIEQSNITNSISYLLSTISIGAGAILAPLSAGASLGLSAIGFATATASYIGKEMGLNAKLEDAKNTMDRLDNTNINTGLTFSYGIGVFEFEFDDDYLIEKYKRFGTEMQSYVNWYKADETLYYYNYIQLQDANFTGAFNENIKSILKSIFENGVRIWYDTELFLIANNYKR